jgi:hypothetical protein
MLFSGHVSSASRNFCVASESDDFANASTVKSLFRRRSNDGEIWAGAPPGERWTGLVLSASVIDRTKEMMASAVVILTMRSLLQWLNLPIDPRELLLSAIDLARVDRDQFAAGKGSL